VKVLQLILREKLRIFYTDELPLKTVIEPTSDSLIFISVFLKFISLAQMGY